MWWDAARIEQTVTRQYVAARLLPDNVDRLDVAPGFGDALTDGTYWEWIEYKAKRIFMVLVDVGIPDQIFGVVDNSMDDDDLPVSWQQIEHLTGKGDAKLNRKFYDRQFFYVLREIQEGTHLYYGEDDVVPLEIVERKTAQNHTDDKVALSNRPDDALSRRRISITSVPHGVSHEEFLSEVRGTRFTSNPHIVSYFASYTYWDSIYILFSASGDYSLKTLLTSMPAALKALSKQARRARIMNWIHCLADSLCYLHSRGRSHRNIKPSMILFDSDHQVLFADTSHLSADTSSSTSERAAFNKESYDFAAPEQWFRPSNHASAQRRTTVSGSTISTSPENYTFSITRGGGGGGSGSNLDPSHNHSTLHASTPHLDPQAADIFSLGCIILELLSLLLKRPSKTFASHRGAKHKSAGRGGAVLDASFHRNLGQVESWMAGLAKEAAAKGKGRDADAAVFRGVAPALQIVARMLAAAPQDRPNANEVERALYRVLTEFCGIGEPHCVHQYGRERGEGVAGELGLGALRIGGGGGGGDDGEDEVWPLAISTHQRRSGGSWGHSRAGSSGGGGVGKGSLGATRQSESRGSGIFHYGQPARPTSSSPGHWNALVSAGNS